MITVTAQIIIDEDKIDYIDAIKQNVRAIFELFLEILSHIPPN